MSQETKTIRPSYYQTDSIYEPIKIIQHYGLNFEISNCLKYCLRAGVKNKETEIEDLVKAKTYLQLRIDYLESLKNKNYKKGVEVMQPLKVWNGDNLNPISDSEKKQWHDDVIPKLISELKVGDEIKAIKNGLAGGDQLFEKDKIYVIKKQVNGLFGINTETNETYIIETEDLHKYFHVSKE